MKLLTTYTCGEGIETDLIPVVIMAHGETTDDLIPALSDDIAEILAMDEIKSATITDNYGHEIEPTVASVCEAIANGTTTIMVHQTFRDTGDRYTDVYTINDFNP